MHRIDRPGSADERLRFAEALLASEVESSPDGVLVVQTDPPGVIYNERFAAMWGVGVGDAPLRDPEAVLDLLSGQLRDPASYRSAVDQARGGKAVTEIEMVLHDGRVIEARGTPLKGDPSENLGRIWFFRDVTDRRHVEQSLQQSHALLATTARLAHVGGWDWDLESDRLTWSEETCRIFGRDPASYTPTYADFAASIHPADAARVQRAVEISKKAGARFEAEFRIVLPDGSVRTVCTEAEIHRDADGRPERMVGTSQDVTQQRATERDLRFANALSTAQLESCPDGILVVGPDRRIVSYNHTFVEMWGLRAEIAESRCDQRAVASILDLLADPASFVARLDELYAAPSLVADEEIHLKDGRVFERHSSPLPIRADAAPGRIFFFRDITARCQAEEQVAKLARYDVVTGLMNRSGFVQALQQAIARNHRGGKGFALLYLDLDHFKDVNDTLGHPAGDLLLQAVAERLRATIREPDVVARFGGDEFAVIQADVCEPTEVAALAERVVSSLREPFPVLGNDIRIGASVGVTLHGHGPVVAATLLSQADLALYRAKAEGRGTYRFFIEGMDEEVRSRVALVADLRKALLVDDQLFLAYQPQVDVATGRIVGVEALARWRHPTRGAVSPGEFIPAAERSGLIAPLGSWVLRTACAQARAWLDEGIDLDVMAVNVSGTQFRTPLDLRDAVVRILAETGLPPQRLELELTESVLMDGWFERHEALSDLRALGIKLSIDDFGTGFSSLQYLTRFPVDRLKIAQTFVRDVTTDPRHATIVRATIGLARDLDLRVIAEGIETREQLDLLTAWSCRDGQGYYFARPLPAADIEPILRSGAIGLRPSLVPRAAHPGSGTVATRPRLSKGFG